MKQPEIFKQLKHQWENPFYDEVYEVDRVEELRNIALNAIKNYKVEKAYLEEKYAERKELLKYFEYLDSLEES